MGCFCTSEAKKEGNLNDKVSKPLAAVRNDGQQFAVYRGKMFFHIYEIKDGDEERKTNKINSIDLDKEIKGFGKEDFEFDPSTDEVMDMAFVGPEEETHLRVYLMVQGTHYFADYDLKAQSATFEQASLYQDQSILQKEGEDESPTMQRRIQVLKNLIEEQSDKGNTLHFPYLDQRLVVVSVQEDPTNKHYMVYDINRENYIRKVDKRIMADDAVAVNSTGQVMAFIEEEDITIRVIRVPNSSILVDRLRPRFNVAESKMNPAQASSNRQTFKDKIYRELHTYHMFKEDPLVEKTLGISEEQNVQLMVLRYEEAVLAQYKLKANRELMMLQKVLLRDAIKTKEMRDLQ